jgi:cytochrome c oxidase subunit 4
VNALIALPTHWRVFVALAVLTVLEVWVTRLGLSDLVSAIVLIGMAISKASLVALYYMHLKHERPLLWYIALFPFVLSAVLVLIAGSDSTLNP